MITYIQAIGARYPNVFCHSAGSGRIYENLIHDGGDPIPSKTELDAVCLELEKDAVWNKIKAERDKRKSGGVQITIEGEPKWFHSDDASRIQILGLVMLGQNVPSGLQWKTMDNSFVTVTAQIAMTVFNTIAFYDQSNFANAEVHRFNVLALQNDPEDYDFSSGWLPMFGE